MEYFPPELKKITVLVQLTAGVSTYEVQGLKDTEFKIWACYLAKKVTSLPDWIIAKFFQINPSYMKSLIESFTVNYLVDITVQEEMKRMENAYRDLETIDAGS